MDVDDAVRVGGGPNGDRHRSVRIPRVRPVRHRADLAVEPGVPDVADDADDLVLEAVPGDADALADRILSGPVLERHGLVDDDSALGVGRVLLVEEPSLQKRHTHRLEIAHV